jgi:hypothetical protein
MQVQETFEHKTMTASGALCGSAGAVLGGFLCVTSGTVALDYGTDATGTDIVPTMAVTAGVFHPMPFSLTREAYATLAGGATGVFAILPR